VSRNSRLNVYRLIPELRTVTVEDQKKRVSVLVLKDEHGLEKRVAVGFFQKNELRKWYRNYNKKTRTEDLPASKKFKKQVVSAIADAKRRGFTHRHLFYGMLRNRKTGKYEYKRMEVFKASAWTQRERGRIFEFFKKHPPKSSLGIFVFSGNKLYMHSLGSHK